MLTISSLAVRLWDRAPTASLYVLSYFPFLLYSPSHPWGHGFDSHASHYLSFTFLLLHSLPRGRGFDSHASDFILSIFVLYNFSQHTPYLFPPTPFLFLRFQGIKWVRSQIWILVASFLYTQLNFQFYSSTFILN